MSAKSVFLAERSRQIGSHPRNLGQYSSRKDRKSRRHGRAEMTQSHIQGEASDMFLGPDGEPIEGAVLASDALAPKDRQT